MRDSVSKLLALLLALLLLSGCGSAPPAVLRQSAVLSPASAAADALREEPEESAEAGDGEMPNFKDIPYERPDLDALRREIAAVESALDRGADADVDELEELINTAYGSYEHFATMLNLAMIRSFQNTADEYYAEEYAWCDAREGEVNRYMEQLFYSCAESPLVEELEERLLWDGFAEDYADRSAAVYSPEVVELMDRESELLSRYYRLRAEADETLVSRFAAVNAASGYYRALIENYRQYNAEIAELYIDMVKVRQELARVRGYDSYEAMVYETSYRRDYTSEQAAAYAREVKTWLAPLYRQLTGMGSYEDYGYLSSRRLFRSLKTGAERMGGRIEDAFVFMAEHGLYDIRDDTAKAELSFQTYLDEYAAPFLYVYPSGGLLDLSSFAHEFGHYVDSYVNGGSSRTVDVSEIFSLTMEYLMLTWTGEALDKAERKTLTRLQLIDTLDLFVEQCANNAFEQAVYAADPDTLSADWLNQQSLLLAMDYGFYDGVSEEYYAMCWSDINHLFESPFYMVAYPLANDLALQLYQRELEREGAGPDGFFELLDVDKEGLVETAQAVGLESPFAEGRVERLAGELSALLLP